MLAIICYNEENNDEKMKLEIHRHDISDKGWEKNQGRTLLDKRKGRWKRKKYTAIHKQRFWIRRTISPWRALPMEYVHWKTYSSHILLTGRQMKIVK